VRPAGSFSKYKQKYFNASTGLDACWYSVPTFDSRVGQRHDRVRLR